jgi:hypothetical protein
VLRTGPSSAVSRDHPSSALEGHVGRVGQQQGVAGDQPGVAGGQQAAAQAQPPEGPCGVEEKGWLVGVQLEEGDRRHVAAVVEKNRDVFAFSLEEIGQFKLFEVELKLKSEQPIFERRRKHSLRE